MNLDDLKKALSDKKPLSEILKKADYCTEEGIANEIVKAGYIKSMNQLRDFFEPIDRIFEEIKSKNQETSFERLNDILPLHFELANRVAREVVKKEFYELVKGLIHKDVLKTNADFIFLHELLSSVIAFQKYRDFIQEGGQK